MAAHGLDSREPDAVIVASFSFFRSKTELWVNGEKGNGLKQRTPFVDGSLEPAEPDFEITDASHPMGVNLSAEAIKLNRHALGGAIKDGDGGDQIQAFEGGCRANAGGL
ncbi:hypothetical protein H6G07_24890 [Phormidium tenue FACHB-1052]|nr:hypothetical protein [Phormidium tenue FACHB-1052]